MVQPTRKRKTCCPDSRLSPPLIWFTLGSGSFPSLLLSLASVELQTRLIRDNVSLLIVDSITSLSHTAQRTERLDLCLKKLKSLARSFSLAVIVTNQVVATRQGELRPGEYGPSVAFAALGTAWAHGVNIRLALEYLPEPSSRARLVIAKASAPVVFVPFEITERGVEQTSAERVTSEPWDTSLRHRPIQDDTTRIRVGFS